MKKLVLLFAVVGIALTSCNGKYTIAKRKYNKGFYVNRSTGNKSTTVEVAQHKVGRSNEIIKSEVVLQDKDTDLAIIAPNVSEQKPSTSIKTTKIESLKAEKNQKSVQETASAKSDLMPQHVQFKMLNSSDFNKSTENTKASDSDTKQILCIILAIFLPPLGMYFWNKKTDMWFIIDLILFLLVFSWFFWGALGLTGLAAVIIALFRVFDKI